MQTNSHNAQNLSNALETIEFMDECQKWNSKPTYSANNVKPLEHRNQNSVESNFNEKQIKNCRKEETNEYELKCDPSLWQTTPADVLNDIEVLIGIDDHFNYESELKNICQTDVEYDDQKNIWEQLPELAFDEELNFNYLNTFKQNYGSIIETSKLNNKLENNNEFKDNLFSLPSVPDSNKKNDFFVEKQDMNGTKSDQKINRFESEEKPVFRRFSERLRNRKNL